MKDIVAFLLLFAAVVPGVVAAPAWANGPAEMDLKERFQVEGEKKAVIFPHRKHQATLACAACHKDPAGGGELVVEFINKKGAGNDFHKKFCWPCHEEKKVAKGKLCSTCHK